MTSLVHITIWSLAAEIDCVAAEARTLNRDVERSIAVHVNSEECTISGGHAECFV